MTSIGQSSWPVLTNHILGERYDEASGATVAQVELSKKRKAEIIKLRNDVEEANIAAKSVLSNLKRK